MNLRFLSAVILSVASLCAATAQNYPVVNRYGTDITSDIALIYAGADTRPAWTLDEVMPYVIHTFADGTKDWFFDAFLILEFHSGSTGLAFQNGLQGKPANKEEWEWMMRQQLVPLASIDSAITIGKQTIGQPRLRHKVVMTIPAAIKNQTRPWGEYNGEELDFRYEGHRLAAERWAVQRLIQLFNEAGFKNIDLEGIYWVEESLYTNGPIMAKVNDWIYRNQLRSYWIPYYKDNEQFKFNWKNYGFDMAYQQPNYFFDRDIPLSRLEDACDESFRYGMGLEMEFESQGKCHVQHGHPDSYYDRLVDYLDVFERKGVFDRASVAWYSGTRGFLDMALSEDPADRQIIDRIAQIVAKRQHNKAQSFAWPKNDIRDLALIYQGGTGRIDWTETDFEPYVAHTFADGTTDWIFDGYLFLEMHSPNASLGTTGRANGAKKEDWKWYLERLYEPGKGIDALNKCIESYKTKIGDPGFKHKVVLNLLPPDYGLKDWGELNGRMLDFNNDSDRVEASKWYIDTLIARFYEGDYKNLELAGLYLFDEDLIYNNGFPKLIAPYIHSLGLEFSWIPYFKARGFRNHKEMGFDIAYMQPNHFFNFSIPYKRLDETIDLAKRFGLAVEFECDGKALSQEKDSKYSRLVDYIQAFEDYGLFDSVPIAYYTGSKMFIDMRDYPSPENQAVMDRLCRHIVDRRNRALSAPSSGSLSVSNGKLTYSSDVPSVGETVIEFAPCMANNLFTFSNVSVDGRTVNHTDSDNIGPFGFATGAWSGGNHTNNGIPSARTDIVKVYADGMPVDIMQNTSMPCNTLTVKVVNTLFMPDGSVPFAIETVKYTTRGNSIDVRVHHDIVAPDSVVIDRYYGMQSMFEGEYEILTPGGKYSTWTPIAHIDRFAKKDSQFFDTFVEHANGIYQAAWLDPLCGIGNRNLVDIDDWVFIGNSYTKSYHKTIGSRTLYPNDNLDWHGVYTWFRQPLTDNADCFEYSGFADGEAALFSVTPSGRTVITKQ